MKKKLLTQLLIFLVLAFFWFDLTALFKSLTSAKISGPLPVFPDIQIQLLQSADANLNKDALEAMKKTLLQYFVPDLSEEPWQIQYLFANLCGTQNPVTPEVIISLSLPPDRGILTVLHKESNSYFLFCSRDNLLPIIELEKLSFLNEREIFFTKEYHDERLGSYNETRLLKLWGWEKNSLEVLWNENNFSEDHWLNTWLNPAAVPTRWSKLVRELSVSYLTDPTPTIQTKGQLAYYEAAAQNEGLPSPLAFNLQISREFAEEFFWSKSWHRFILKTGTYKPPGINSPQKIAILKDLENQPESLVNQESGKYQVITPQGSIFIAEKKYIELDN